MRKSETRFDISYFSSLLKPIIYPLLTTYHVWKLCFASSNTSFVVFFTWNSDYKLLSWVIFAWVLHLIRVYFVIQSEVKAILLYSRIFSRACSPLEQFDSSSLWLTGMPLRLSKTWPIGYLWCLVLSNQMTIKWKPLKQPSNVVLAGFAHSVRLLSSPIQDSLCWFMIYVVLTNIFPCNRFFLPDDCFWRSMNFRVASKCLGPTNRPSCWKAG